MHTNRGLDLVNTGQVYRVMHVMLYCDINSGWPPTTTVLMACCEETCF